MLKKKRNKRERYPQDEAKYEWLPLLLDAYHVSDEGITEELGEEGERRGHRVACHKGCHVCCLKPAVPITPLEFKGISWYVSENMGEPVRSKVREQLLKHQESTACPFLVEQECSIYPVRPLACRQFYMFREVCKEGEDPAESRPADMFQPSRDIAQRVSLVMLPHYGITEYAEKVKAFEAGYIGRQAGLMCNCDWNLLVHTMNIFDKHSKKGKQ
jgi:Fe-S-cluster containining protein